jgi:hypothetical protein
MREQAKKTWKQTYQAELMPNSNRRLQVPLAPRLIHQIEILRMYRRELNILKVGLIPEQKSDDGISKGKGKKISILQGS